MNTTDRPSSPFGDPSDTNSIDFITALAEGSTGDEFDFGENDNFGQLSRRHPARQKSSKRLTIISAAQNTTTSSTLVPIDEIKEEKVL